MSLANAYVTNKSYDERKENDYYPTPSAATKALVNYYKSVIPDDILEPAAGRGWISATLLEMGYNVTSTDLYPYENSLVPIKTGVDYMNTQFISPGIITNPPYKKNMAEGFARKAIVESDFCAMFLRLTFMESKRRHKLFKEYPPSVLVFSDRMNCDETRFTDPGGQFGGMVAYAWFVWGKGIIPGSIDWALPSATL